MKIRVIPAVACLVVALWIGAAVLAASDSPGQGQPGLKSAANGPKETPPGLERIVFIHYRKGFGKPEGTPGKKPPSDGPSCYGFIARGAKLQSLPVNYTVGKPDGWTGEFPSSAFSAAASEWGHWTAAGLFGSQTVKSGVKVDTSTTDEENDIVFDDLGDQNTIAVTIVWGWFSGPASTRRIVEFDMILNTQFTWGDAAGDSSVMDVQNIVTHELGHALGLDDVYQSACSDVTMYGYSTEGDTVKRDLAAEDITGLQQLYGGL